MASKRLPLVVVLGATGAGKSNLALEIAKAFKGEIISADSMQIYKGLDIITNKVTEEEQKICKHHLISYIEPSHLRYTIKDFQEAALPIIEDLLQRNILPIVVGGTNYYIESLLWDFTLQKYEQHEDEPEVKKIRKNEDSLIREVVQSNNKKVSDFASGHAKENNEELLNDSDALACHTKATSNLSSIHGDSSLCVSELLSPPGKILSINETNNPILSEQRVILHDEAESLLKSLQALGRDESAIREMFTQSTPGLLHQALQIVDPKFAESIHPNNHRRSERGLEHYLMEGETLTQAYSRQHQEHPGNPSSRHISGPLRFPNPLILWVKCDQDILNERINKRADEMVERGVVAELEAFHAAQREHSDDPITSDYSRGLMQNIGHKELKEYLELEKEERDTTNGVEALKRGIEKIKVVTRQYARYQTKWINRRFIARPDANAPPVYSIDSSDKTQWPMKVQEAVYLVQNILKGQKPSKAPEVNNDLKKVVLEKNFCEACNKTIMYAHMWQAHLQSKGHKHHVKKLNKQRRKLSETLEAREEQLRETSEQQGGVSVK